MLSTFSATKLAVFLGSILLTFFMVAHFPADAGRTQYDEEYSTIIVYDCAGYKCSQTVSYRTITVPNSHWTSYHNPPVQSGHNNGHSASVRHVTYKTKVTRLATRCDGTACAGSGTGDDG